MKTRMKIFQPKTKSVFLPKISCRPKKKKVFTHKFSPGFDPKLGENHKKKRSSLKFSPAFGQKKSLRPPFLCSNLLPKLQRGGGGGGDATICILFYANYTILATQRGGHGPMPFPKYARDCSQFKSPEAPDFEKITSVSSSVSTLSLPTSFIKVLPLPTSFIKVLPLPQKINRFRFHIPALNRKLKCGM